LFCRLAEIWPHGVLGLLQHYRRKAVGRRNAAAGTARFRASHLAAALIGDALSKNGGIARFGEIAKTSKSRDGKTRGIFVG
jgi:hypothetical protein